MTYPPPPYPQYPSGPPGYGPPPSGPVRLRGRTPRRLGWIFLAVGIVLTVVGATVYETQSLSKVDKFSRVSIAAGGGTANFSTGNYLAYYEAKGANDKTKNIPIVAIRLTSPSGKQMVLDTLYGGGKVADLKIKSYLVYSHNGHDGIAVYQFKITEAGEYRVEFAGTDVAASNSDMAFGPSIGKSTAIAGALVAVGVLLIIAAIVLLIVGFVKKRRHKREIAAYAGAGSPPYPGTAYPPPAYPSSYPPPGQGFAPPPPPPPSQPTGFEPPPGYQQPSFGEPPTQT